MSYPYNYAASSATTMTLAWSPTDPVYVGSTIPQAAPPKPPSALDWLDQEIEKTCAIARSAA